MIPARMAKASNGKSLRSELRLTDEHRKGNAMCHKTALGTSKRAAALLGALALLLMWGMPAGCGKAKVEGRAQVPEVGRRTSYQAIDVPPSAEAGEAAAPAKGPPEAVEPAGDVPPKPEPLEGPSARIHVVEKGDTLWSLANRYLGDGRRWREIQQANGGIDTKKLRIGQKLLIPEP
jgi:LysM repeat protein